MDAPQPSPSFDFICALVGRLLIDSQMQLAEQAKRFQSDITLLRDRLQVCEKEREEALQLVMGKTHTSLHSSP